MLKLARETYTHKINTHPKILTSETIKKIKNFLIIQTNDELWEFIFHRDSTQKWNEIKILCFNARSSPHWTVPTEKKWWPSSEHGEVDDETWIYEFQTAESTYGHGG